MPMRAALLAFVLCVALGGCTVVRHGVGAVVGAVTGVEHQGSGILDAY
jgi:hypothetical protein